MFDNIFVHRSNNSSKATNLLSRVVAPIITPITVFPLISVIEVMFTVLPIVPVFPNIILYFDLPLPIHVLSKCIVLAESPLMEMSLVEAEAKLRKVSF